MPRKHPLAGRRPGWPRTMAAVSLAFLLPGCSILGYMVMGGVAVGFELEDRQRARRIDRNLSKLPPDEQAVARLWQVRDKHGHRRAVGPKDEAARDARTRLTCTRVMIATATKQEALAHYDRHFAKFGWRQVTPPAAKALRSYVLHDHRVDIGVATPSSLQDQPRSGEDPRQYSDLVIRVTSPRRDEPGKDG